MIFLYGIEKAYFTVWWDKNFALKTTLKNPYPAGWEEAKAAAEIPSKVMEAETAASTAEFPTESVQESWRIGFSRTYKSATWESFLAGIGLEERGKILRGKGEEKSRNKRHSMWQNHS